MFNGHHPHEEVCFATDCDAFVRAIVQPSIGPTTDSNVAEKTASAGSRRKSRLFNFFQSFFENVQGRLHLLTIDDQRRAQP